MFFSFELNEFLVITTMARIVLIASVAQSLLAFRGCLLEDMVAEGHQVLTCAPPTEEQVIKDLRNLGVDFCPLPMARNSIDPRGDLQLARRMKQLFEAQKPDLVFSYTIKPVIYGSLVARWCGIPSAAMITGLGKTFSGISRQDRAVEKIVRLLYRVSLRRANPVFFQNPDDLQLFWRAGLVKRDNRPTMIPGSGVDLDFFTPRPFPKQPSFLLLARMIAAKGIPEYVAAAKILRRKYPFVRIRMAGFITTGSGSITAQQIEDWQRDAGVEFLGGLDDVRPALTNTSVYVLPSWYREGIPRSILEAMAMGRPIITTDAPGCRETVRPDENGFLVPERDAEALANAMIKFVEQPELIEKMGTASRLLAEQRFDVRRVNNIILHRLGLRQSAANPSVRKISSSS